VPFILDELLGHLVSLKENTKNTNIFIHRFHRLPQIKESRNIISLAIHVDNMGTFDDGPRKKTSI